MKKNLGSADRVVRLILAAVLGFLYYNKTVTGTLGIIFLVLAVVLLLTSFISFCPLYAIFGLKTSKIKEVKS
jgi:hypothetical protein